MTRTRWWWERLAPLVMWTAFILLVASLPSSFFLGPRTTATGMPRRLVQYPYHVGAFLVLAILFLRCVRATTLGERPRRAELLSLLGAILVSMCSELIQLWVPTRTPAARDLALDLSGALFGLGLMRVRRPGQQALGPRPSRSVSSLGGSGSSVIPTGSSAASPTSPRGGAPASSPQ